MYYQWSLVLTNEVCDFQITDYNVSLIFYYRAQQEYRYLQEQQKARQMNQPDQPPSQGHAFNPPEPHSMGHSAPVTSGSDLHRGIHLENKF
jgi:hypothetical protein